MFVEVPEERLCLCWFLIVKDKLGWLHTWSTWHCKVMQKKKSTQCTQLPQAQNGLKPCDSPENMHVGIRATKGNAEAIFSMHALMLCLALAVEHSLSAE